MPDPAVSLLSNGRYHALLTGSGSGYSAWNGLALTALARRCSARRVGCVLLFARQRQLAAAATDAAHFQAQLSGRVGAALDLRVGFTLAPGQQHTAIFRLGCGTSAHETQALVQRWRGAEAADAALAAVLGYWHLVGAEGQGESVWLGVFLVTVLGRFAPLARQHGDGEFADRCEHEATALVQRIEAVDPSCRRTGAHLISSTALEKHTTTSTVATAPMATPPWCWTGRRCKATTLHCSTTDCPTPYR